MPQDAWDQRPVNLTLGGLIELHVDQGGAVEGAPGSALTVGELYNEGVIRLPGGTLTQSEVLPNLYVSSGNALTAIGVHSLSDIFTTGSDGTIAEAAPNAMGLKDLNGERCMTNGQAAGTIAIYLLGDLNEGQGMLLAPGSVTDLSGEAVVNPRATPMGGVNPANYQAGTVLNGGALQVPSALSTTGAAALFHAPIGLSIFGAYAPMTAVGAVDSLDAAAGAQINLAGAAAVLDEPVVRTFVPGTRAEPSYRLTPVWSDGGSLTLGSPGVK